MKIDRYLEQIVDPTIKDLEANPTSRRHAFLYEQNVDEISACHGDLRGAVKALMLLNEH